MGRGKKTKPDFATSNGKHFNKLYDDMIDSPAFSVLSPTALKTFLVIYCQYKGGSRIVTCPYSVLKSHGLRSSTISKGIQELNALGFIETQSGGFKECNHYKLSGAWKMLDKKSARAAKQSFTANWNEKHTSG